MTDAIITDAGFETISYELATQFFSASDIQYWWTSVADLDEFEAIELEKQVIQSKGLAIPNLKSKIVWSIIFPKA